MIVNERYAGEVSYAIMKNSNSRYILVTGSTFEGLYQHLDDMIRQHNQLKVLARYGNVNLVGRRLILNAIRDLNRRKKIKKLENILK